MIAYAPLHMPVRITTEEPDLRVTQVTFAWDFPNDGFRHVEPYWPGRLQVSLAFLQLAQADQLESVTFDGLLLRITCTNARAVYRLVPQVVDIENNGPVEFECIESSQELPTP